MRPAHGARLRVRRRPRAWFQGLVAFAQGRLGDAQAQLRGNARRRSSGWATPSRSAAAHNLLAALYYYLGDEQRWRHRIAAFAGPVRSRARRDSSTRLLVTAAAVGPAHRARKPRCRCRTLAVRQRAESGREARDRRGRWRSARQLCWRWAAPPKRSATWTTHASTCRSLPDPSFRSSLEVAGAGGRKRPRSAAAIRRPRLSAASRAIETIAATRRSLRLRAVQPAAGARPTSRGDITPTPRLRSPRASRRSTNERASLVDEGRISTLDESWQLFETSVSWRSRRSDYPRAFAMAERARARTLAEARRMPERSLSDVQQRTGA